MPCRLATTPYCDGILNRRNKVYDAQGKSCRHINERVVFALHLHGLATV